MKEAGLKWLGLHFSSIIDVEPSACVIMNLARFE
jgi:hypothetical protein